MMDDVPHPRTQHELVGHEEAIKLLMHEWGQGTLPGSWLIHGPQGIGKATLAYHLARSVLSGEPMGYIDFHSGSAQRVEVGSHMDLLVIEPKYDPKKDKIANDISVDQAREVPQFLSLTSGESGWRVVIIDTIDAMNANAANAILKTLEEPPSQSLIVLISNNPDILLPTIRSRCRSVRLLPLPESGFSRVMRHALADLEPEEMDVLSCLSYHSPGLAISLHAQDACATYEDILSLVERAPDVDALALYRLSEQYGGKGGKSWDVLSAILLTMLQRVALLRSGQALKFVSRQEERALTHLCQYHDSHVWAEKYQHACQHFSTVERLHFDPKQVIIAFISTLTQAEGLQLGLFAA